MKTAIVILNFNTKDFLLQYLPALLESIEGMDAFVVVADNGSTDGSVAMLQNYFPQVKVLPFNANYGFTGGYNKALAQVDAEYFLLLNSDIEVPQGWLQPLQEWMETHPQCGICGPKLLQMSQRGRFEYAGAAGGMIDRCGFPYCRGRVLSKVEDDNGQYDALANVAWVSGAALMVRSRLWKELGGLDCRFFAHMEEIDLCWRAQAAGYNVSVVPTSKVYHLGGGTLPAKSPRKLYLNYRNNLLMLDNNLPDDSRGVLAFRFAIDILAAAAYLLTLRLESFKAVCNAHSDFKAIRKGPVSGNRINILSKEFILVKYFKTK